MKKLGFDIHDVIDSNPSYFAGLFRKYKTQGYEIHIITGSRDSIELRAILETWGILFDKFFSIADWCLANSRTSTVRKDGNVFDDDDVWNNAKAHYCMREGIDVHVDDSIMYKETFKNINTRFVLYDKDELRTRFEMNEIIASIDENCEHYPCTKHCPQYILYRDKVRNVINSSTIEDLASDQWAELTDNHLPKSMVDDLVDAIFLELG